MGHGMIYNEPKLEKISILILIKPQKFKIQMKHLRQTKNCLLILKI